MKKKFLKISVVFICFLASKCLQAQNFEIKGAWKFTTGDNPSWSSEELDDRLWASLNIQSIWEEQGFIDYDGIGWYRKKIVIPSSLKSLIGKSGVYNLCVGKIDDDDETYFNGKLVGKTSTYTTTRNYPIYENDIRWDKENTISIRVKDYSGGGGMWKGKVAINAPLLQGVITPLLRATLTEFDSLPANKMLDGDVSITNNSTKAIKVILRLNVYDENNKALKNLKYETSIGAGETYKQKYLENTTGNLLKIETKVTVDNYKDTLFKTLVRGYKDIAYERPNSFLNYPVKQAFTTLPLQNITLNGFLGERISINTNVRLLHADISRMLAGFMTKPGEQDWIGEHAGKFLDAACRTYANTPVPQLKKIIDLTAQHLIAAQLQNGYLGTYLSSDYWSSWDVWVHKYDLIGLLAYYNISGYKPALESAKKIGILLYNTFGNEYGKSDIIQAGEHMGMAATSVIDPLTDLYRFTGDQRFMVFCNYIISSYNNKNGPAIITSLNSTHRVDKTANGKAYEMLSNLIGMAKLYFITKDQKLLEPILYAWDDMVTNRLYVTGTASSFEHFQDNGVLPATATDNMGEGCVTTTWIQLNYQLYLLTGHVKFINEIERSVYNHLIAAENPQTGCVSYYTPLMGKKPFSCDITCCLSSIPRGISMIPLFAYGKLNGSPLINFYESGSFSTGINTASGVSDVTFKIISQVPVEGNTSIKIYAKKTVKFPLQLRIPDWCSNYSITVNQLKINYDNKSGFAVINRVWKDADEVNITFTMPVKELDGGVSYPHSLAFQRGPQILAFDESLNREIPKPAAISINPGEISDVSDVQLRPLGWIGNQFYQARLIYNDIETFATLVPFSDASQSGGASFVWLPKK